jgi:Uma2 family endonuclease
MSVKQLVTAEELWDMPDVPGKRFELVDGEVVEVPGAGAIHGLILFALAQLLQEFVRKHDLGLVMPDGVAYVLRRAPDQVRVPDVSYVAWDRVPEEGAPEGFWEGAPTLAVEVVSPHDRADDIHERVQDYLVAGSAQVWVLWPRQSSITVHRGDGSIRNLRPDEILNGHETLPGFSVRVGNLFEVQRRR